MFLCINYMYKLKFLNEYIDILGLQRNEKINGLINKFKTSEAENDYKNALNAIMMGYEDCGASLKQRNYKVIKPIGYGGNIFEVLNEKDKKIYIAKSQNLSYLSKNEVEFYKLLAGRGVTIKMYEHWICRGEEGLIEYIIIDKWDPLDVSLLGRGIIGGICDLIMRFHKLGYVHNDLHQENIVTRINGKMEFALIDFQYSYGNKYESKKVIKLGQIYDWYFIFTSLANPDWTIRDNYGRGIGFDFRNMYKYNDLGNMFHCMYTVLSKKIASLSYVITEEDVSLIPNRNVYKLIMAAKTDGMLDFLGYVKVSDEYVEDKLTGRKYKLSSKYTLNNKDDISFYEHSMKKYNYIICYTCYSKEGKLYGYIIYK